MTNLTNCPDCQEVLSLGARKCRCGWKYKSLPLSENEIRAQEERNAQVAIESLGELYDQAVEDIKAIKKEHPDDWRQIYMDNFRAGVKRFNSQTTVDKEKLKEEWYRDRPLMKVLNYVMSVMPREDDPGYPEWIEKFKSVQHLIP